MCFNLVNTGHQNGGSREEKEKHNQNCHHVSSVVITCHVWSMWGKKTKLQMMCRLTLITNTGTVDILRVELHHVWQFQVEIKHYSIVYFLTVLPCSKHCSAIGQGHTCSVDLSGILTSSLHVYMSPALNTSFALHHVYFDRVTMFKAL